MKNLKSEIYKNFQSITELEQRKWLLKEIKEMNGSIDEKASFKDIIKYHEKLELEHDLKILNL